MAKSLDSFVSIAVREICVGEQKIRRSPFDRFAEVVKVVEAWILLKPASWNLLRRLARAIILDSPR